MSSVPEDGVFRVVVVGDAVPQLGARHVKRGRHHVSFRNPKTANYQRYVAMEALRQMGQGWTPLACPVSVGIVVYRSLPAHAPKWLRRCVGEAEERVESGDEWSIDVPEGRDWRRVYPATKPDFDNYAKSICDALEGIAYERDGQIVVGRVEKRFTVKVPRVVIEVRPAQNGKKPV